MSDFSELNEYRRKLELSEKPLSELSGHSALGILRFAPDLERRYLGQRAEEVLPLQRFALLLATAFFLAFFGLDALLWQQYQARWAVLPILVLSSAANLLMLLCIHRPFGRQHNVRIAALNVLCVAVCFAWASAQGYRHGSPIPPEAPVMQQLYNLFLLGLPLRLAAPIMLSTVLIFIGLHAATPMAATALFERSFMMVSAGVIGLLAAYLIERTQRLAWLRAQLLRELSERDPLTGLYNHRLFYQRGQRLLSQARQEGRGMAVLLVDVDHFKQYNDRHGHLAGDECLRHVAEALSRGARRPQDLVARIGGEEFGLLLYDIQPEAARQRAEELRQSMSHLPLPEERRVRVSAGYSHAVGDCEPPSIEALVGRADLALYRAKAEGRDRVCGG